MDRGIRILQVNKLYFPHIGGVEKVVQRLGEGLARVECDSASGYMRLGDTLGGRSK